MPRESLVSGYVSASLNTANPNSHNSAAIYKTKSYFNSAENQREMPLFVGVLIQCRLFVCSL